MEASTRGLTVSELAPGLHSVGQRRGGRVHAYIADGGSSGLTLVDTLFDDDARGVLEALRGIGRSVDDVKQIVLTHAHRSHLGGVAALKRLTNATVYAHEWEADIIAGDRRAQPVPPRPLRPLVLWPFRIGLALGRPKHVPCDVDQAVGEGDRIGPLEVLHTPGHSPGHLAFFWDDRRVLIAGDAVATWPDFGAGWPGFNLNLDQHRESVARMAGLGAQVVGVGHGDPIAQDAADRVRSLVGTV